MGVSPWRNRFPFYFFNPDAKILLRAHAIVGFCVSHSCLGKGTGVTSLPLEAVLQFYEFTGSQLNRSCSLDRVASAFGRLPRDRYVRSDPHDMGDLKRQRAWTDQIFAS